MGFFNFSSLSGETRRARLLPPAGGEALQLYGILASEAISSVYSYMVSAVSHDDSIDLTDLLGKLFVVEFDIGAGAIGSVETRYFTGYLNQARYLGHPEKHAVYELELVPFLSMLENTQDCRIFQEKTVLDIVQEVCQEHQFTQLAINTQQNHPVLEYCVQYRESTRNFIQRLLENTGIHYFFEHDKQGHTMVLVDQDVAHQPVMGNARVPYLIPGKNLVERDFHFSSWESRKTLKTGLYTVKDYNLLTPRVDLLKNVAGNQTHDYAQFEIYDYPGVYADVAEGDHYVQKRLVAEQAQVGVVEATGNVANLQPGRLCTLFSHPRKQENGEYLVLSVMHQLTVGDLSSGEQDHFEYANKATLMPSSVPYCPMYQTRKPFVQGMQTAVVTGPPGEEIWPDEHGRVKVQFHWDRDGQGDDKTTCWVPVSQHWAGKQWGTQFLPRIGDEVIVDFIEGNPDRPVITGRLYNGKNKPTYGLPANKTQSGIKTRSSPGGGVDNFNELRFEDKKGSEEVYLHAEKDMNSVVENNQTHSVGVDRTKSIGQDETVSVGRNRTESVGQNETITVGTDRTETVGSNENITIGANRTEQVGGNESVSIEANRTEQVSGNETITVTLLRTHNIGVNDMLNVGVAQEVSVGGIQQITVGGARNVSVGMSQSSQVAKNQSVKVGDTLTVDVGKKIVFKAGEASITLQEDGAIIISGSEIRIKSSKDTSVKASGNIVIKGKKLSQN